MRGREGDRRGIWRVFSEKKPSEYPQRKSGILCASALSLFIKYTRFGNDSH